MIDSVYARLINLPVGDEIEYNPQRGSQEKWDEFILCVKRFIDDHHIHPDYTIQIRSDYGAIKKIKHDTQSQT